MLRARSPELVLAILGAVYDAPDPYGWTELVDTFSSSVHPWKTVENTLYDLVAIGALHRTGQPATRTRPDTRQVRPTVLGRAWLDQTILPLPERRQS